MIKILVPTDFSSNAENAVNFAVSIANRNGGYIQLFHSYQVPSSTGSFISVERFIKKDAIEAMSKLVKKIESKVETGVIVDFSIVNDLVVSSICSKANKDKYDLIVMGTQGESGLKGRFFGSNTAAILNKTKLPLLVIPEKADSRKLDKIVFAVDDNAISSKEVVAVLNYIKNQFEANLMVFHLENKVDKEKGIHSSIKQFVDYDVLETTNFETGQNLNAAIDENTKRNNTNLLCMIKRDRSLWSILLNPSATRSEVGHSSIPLLVLHD